MFTRIAKVLIVIATIIFAATACFLMALPRYPSLGLRWAWFSASGPKQCDFSEVGRSVAYEKKFNEAGQQILASARLVKEDGPLQLWDIPGARQFWVSSKSDVNGKLNVRIASAFAEQAADEYNHPDVHMQPGDVVLDVGADHGDVTDKALRMGASKVVAIEIDPAKWECLTRTFAQEIKDGRVVVEQLGVWDKDGQLELSGDSVIFDNRTAKKTVRVITIDEMVKDLHLPKVDFITMDIEGAEKPALRGAAETIRRYHPRMAISAEHLPDDINAIPETIRKIDPAYSVICGQCTMKETHRLSANVLWFHVQ